MSVKKGRSTLVGALVVFAMALFAQGAQASITPSVTLDQSAGTQAGACQNLGMDLKFDGSSANSAVSATPRQHLTINLPPGSAGQRDGQRRRVPDRDRRSTRNARSGPAASPPTRSGAGAADGRRHVRPRAATVARRPRRSCGQHETAPRSARPVTSRSARQATPTASGSRSLSMLPNSLDRRADRHHGDRQHIRRPALSDDLSVDAGERRHQRRFLLRLDGPHVSRRR